MTRDLDVLRKRLQDHRDVLAELEADAPSQALAERYAGLRAWIEATISTLDSTPPPEAALPPPAAAPASAASAVTAERELDHYDADGAWTGDEAQRPARDGWRMLSVLVLGLAALALLAFLFFRFFSEREPGTGAYPIREISETSEMSEVETADEVVIIEDEPPPVAAAPPPRIAPGPAQQPPGTPTTTARLGVEPAFASADGFGNGRMIRQFRIENPSSEAVRITIERSSCRCLWYDVNPDIPAGGGVVLEVTVDGSRLQGDNLDETIGVLRASDKARLAEFRLTGTR